MQQPDGVAHERRHAGTEFAEPLDDLVDVERVAAGLLDQRVLGNGTLAHQSSETVGVEDVADPDADTA